MKTILKRQISCLKGRCYIVVWLFILVTVITYSVVMAYVLKNVQKPAAKAFNMVENTNSHEQLVPIHTR